ncbi:MAG: hypothetical protein DWQ02_09270 [Bacteroidetes bacterium]|nr:MAG: hypothetical protein DWQ02_09270 [Bacteroidota bacterium]
MEAITYGGQESATFAASDMDVLASSVLFFSKTRNGEYPNISFCPYFLFPCIIVSLKKGAHLPACPLQNETPFNILSIVVFVFKSIWKI